MDSGNLHALTEFCNEGSLDKLILSREKKFSWRLRASLALDMARGMEYAHSMGFMHRDFTAMVSPTHGHFIQSIRHGVG